MPDPNIHAFTWTQCSPESVVRYRSCPVPAMNVVPVRPSAESEVIHNGPSGVSTSQRLPESVER